MPEITLPDGSRKSFPETVTGLGVAESIGASVAKAAVAVRVDGDLRDLSAEIAADAAVEIVTRTSADGLEILRHDAAHVMAEAVKELYPETQVTIGPAIEDGFYYDFARDEAFTPEDLERIEARMRDIVRRDEPVVREVWDRAGAVDFFKDQGEVYKAEIIASIPRARRSPFTGRAGSSICAGAPTCPPPGGWAALSSSPSWPAHIGGAIPETRCCSASTAPPGAATRT